MPNLEDTSSPYVHNDLRPYHIREGGLGYEEHHCCVDLDTLPDRFPHTTQARQFLNWSHRVPHGMDRDVWVASHVKWLEETQSKRVVVF